MDKIVSNKIRILSFYSIFMVVVCHAYNLTNLNIEKDRDLVYYIEYLFALEISSVFIPMFFFISGFLFFKNHDFTIFSFKRKIKNRFKSLVIPYILWCGLWFIIIYLIQLIPNLSGFFEIPLHTMSIYQQLWFAFVDPINYTFWFIRELICYIWLTPFLYFALKHLKCYFLIFLGFLLFLKQPSLFFIKDVYLLQFLGLFSFTFGAYISMSKTNIISKFKPQKYYLILIIYSIAIVFNFYVRDALNETDFLSILCRRLTMFIGFFTIWVWYDFIDKKYHFKNKNIYSYRFFIYAAHGVVLSYFTKFYVSFIGEDPFILLILFFISSLIAAIGCVYSAKIMQKLTPSIYSLMTGSR